MYTTLGLTWINKSLVYLSYPVDRINKGVIYRLWVPDNFINKTLRHCHSRLARQYYHMSHYKSLDLLDYSVSWEIVWSRPAYRRLISYHSNLLEIFPKFASCMFNLLWLVSVSEQYLVKNPPTTTQTGAELTSLSIFLQLFSLTNFSCTQH